MAGSEMLIVILTALVLCLYATEGESQQTVHANYLGSHRRFNESAYYDWYYCCNTCGGTLQWLVNGEHAAYHTSQRSRLGEADFITFAGDSTTVQHASLLLSVRSNNTQICMDALLIVTQAETDQLPNVVCRSASEQVSVVYPINDTSIQTQVNNGTVKLVHSVDSRNVVSPGNNFTTQVLVCASNGSHQSWEISGRFRTGYHSINNVGQSRYDTHPSNSEVAMDSSLLLQKSANRYTSLFIYSDYDVNSNYDIECQSDDSSATVSFNQPNVTNEMITKEEMTSSSAPLTSMPRSSTSEHETFIIATSAIDSQTISSTTDVVSSTISSFPSLIILTVVPLLASLIYAS